MKEGDFVYIKPVSSFGFIKGIGIRKTRNKEVKIYVIIEPRKEDNWYFYDKHLVLLYES